MNEAYAYAREIARIHGESDVALKRGYRLVWGRVNAFRCLSLIATDDNFAVVGRHSRCDVVLRHDPFIALRHLLVRSVALPKGGVGLRILDLQSSLGFTLADGSRHTSIFAEGPIAIAIGDYALVALPMNFAPRFLPHRMPKAVVSTPPVAVRDQLLALSVAMSPYRTNARPSPSAARIMPMPSPFMVGRPMPPRLSRLAKRGHYALTLSRGENSATVTLSEDDLERGVMIGRSDKCHAERLRQITSEKTSRAHVLLLREGEVVSAYDLASTQGTYEHSLPTRRVVLSEQGSTITLGRGSHAVRLRWHPRA